MGPGRDPAAVTGKVDPERVWFTFPDGRFSYECGPCGACCRGLGIGIDAAGGQLERLVELFPALRPFLRRRGPAWTAFNPRGSCWFLQGNGLCRVEVEHGRAMKPAACRLFPFNRIFRLGSWTVVDFNSVICPLTVAEEGSGVSWSEVLAEIDSVADPAIVGTPLPSDNAEREGRALFERESSLSAQVFADLDAPLAQLWSLQSETPLAESIATVSTVCELASGRSFTAPSAEMQRIAAALCSSMRFNELYGPRRWSSREDLVGILPRIWLAWVHFVALGEELAGRPLTMQEATTVWSEVVGLCWLAARSDEVLGCRSGTVALVDGPERPLVQKVIESLKRPHRRSLGSILSDDLANADGDLVVAALRGLEPVLSSLTTSQTRRSRARRKRRR